jgi:hypothetical protein
MEALRCLKRHLSNVVYATMMAGSEEAPALVLDT